MLRSLRGLSGVSARLNPAVAQRGMNKLAGLTRVVPCITYHKIKDEACMVVTKENLLFTMNVLKKHINFQFTMLSCISGVDFLNKKYRFSVVYDLLSLTFNTRMRIKIFANETSSVDSIVSVFVNANWWEREVWDLFGVYFDKHPDLRRILTDYGFEGHPMRKDFPLSGFVELRYDEIKKRIVVEPLQLTQDFRLFNYQTVWK
jgi:NADH dehydrogenase (ubiquinone) Fe-S protein 3